MLKIIAGSHKGQLLTQPNANVTRPVSQKLKGAVFNVLATKTADSLVLDLFAGSGALGIEALSRGAKSVTFVDSSAKVCQTIAANLKKLNFSGTDNSRVVKSTVDKFIAKTTTKFDIIFIDPPYTEFDTALVNMALNLLKSTGVVVVSCSSSTQLQRLSQRATVLHHKNYGDSAVYFIGTS